MSFPSNYSWGNQSNDPANSQRQDVPLGLNNWQQFGTNVQGSWQHQNVAPQSYMHQQTNWNNNPTQKSAPSQMDYKNNSSYSWSHMQQPHHYQSHQYQYSNNPNQFFEEVSNNPNPSLYNTGQQMSYNTDAASDPWNWGWDESNTTTPSSSFTTNTNNNVTHNPTNWNIDNNVEEFNPVQNYFQQSGGKSTPGAKTETIEQFRNEVNAQPNTVPVTEYVDQTSYDNREKGNFSDDKTPESALMVENAGDLSQDSEMVFSIKSESAQSLQSSNLSNQSEAKMERLSPDPNKIPLTAQALREFCKEKYENGPVDLKFRNNIEGLTPQWSVESQMSQETASDDISPSMQKGSHSDVSNWELESGQVENDILNSFDPSPRLIQEQSSNSKETNRIDNLEDDRNQQVISTGSGLPPPPPSIRSDGSNSNPYSLSQKLQNKMFQKTENTSGNEYGQLVQQMEQFSVSDNFNQQVVGRTNFSPGTQSGNWYGKRVGMGEEQLNQEAIPDNKERPEAEEHRPPVNDSKFPIFNSKNPKAQGSRHQQTFAQGLDNQEVAPCTDRNQYLETGRLEDQMESDLVPNDNDLTAESLPPPGLSRLVPGEIQPDPSGNTQSSTIDISSPPPGLDRMVLGQITENESGTVPDGNSFSRDQNTPPPGLHRMVPGQLRDDQIQRSPEETTNLPSNVRRNDIPPPGLRRMVPGESSSPESQNVIQMPMDPREQRVVTGVAKDDMGSSLQANIPAPSPTPANRLVAPTASPEESRLQFQSERCETIGSDNVDNYSPNPGDSSKLSKRKETKDRERHREDISSDETERDPPRRHERDSDYYSKRDRNRERDDSSGERYERERRKGRERVDWDRDRRKDSPGRYREERGRRRDYREDRRRHKDYDYSDDDDDDADTNGYYSDRDRRNASRYRDDYDREYSRRDDRARSLRPEKSLKDTEESSESSYKDRATPRRPFPEKFLLPYEAPLSLVLDSRSSGKGRRHDRGYGDRDLDRDRNRERGKDRDRQSDYYRRRDDLDDYRDGPRSRPSSRNDSIQDYKHRSGRSDYDGDSHKEKDHYRGHSKRDREMFYPPGYNYDPAYYNYYYQYYENLRRTNPGAYAEWFRKYYASSQHGTFDGTYTEDRGSVHSGRSSANEDSKDRYLKTDAGFGYPCYQSLASDQIYPCRSHSTDTGENETGRRLDSALQMEQRLTPAKFTTAHVKGILTPRGQLLKILAHYPLDGQPATLEIHENLSCLDDLRKELLNFPGPLVKGVTHKNNILRYCKQKIKEADSNSELFDKESYKLIWELLILLIRQNGTVVGTDIAELLMSNRTSHVSRQQTSHSNVNEGGNSQSSLNEEEVTNQFRDYLIYGNTKEALEWAMKHGLWGHALFLASKMDQRTYASVMTRFANGLTMNDPLQTLYQLMSGRQPASVTCCADEKWGDWRPHLAMILSNSSTRPDLDLKAVTTLGDTLGSRGNLHAAHFCYLMAQVEFGTFAHKSSKIVLIGSSHSQPFSQFANNEAIFATEIFEFACSLADPEFALHHLQSYKLLMAKRLAEVGLTHEAVHYVEVIANTVAKFPAQYPPHFIEDVYNLGNMLKYFDPVYNSSEGSVSDPEWLLQLLNILNDYQTGVLQHDGYGSVSNLTTYSENEGVQNLPLDPGVQETGNDVWKNQQQVYYDQTQQQQQQQQQQLQQQQQQQQQQQPPPQQQWHQNDQSNYGFHSNNNKGYMSVEQPVSTPPSADSTNHSYWGGQNQWPQSQTGLDQSESHQPNDNNYLSGIGVETTENIQNQSLYNYYDPNRNEGQAPLPGTLTLPHSKPRTVSQSSEDRKQMQAKSKTAKKEPSKHNQTTGSWFGGIWNKLPFRPKNQMILPDDKNPSIVWDSDKNRWVNLNADEDDSGGSVPPPPKASELASPVIPNSGPVSALASLSPYTPNPVPGSDVSDQPDATSTPTLPPSGPNKYKMTRGKSLRSNYVDVLNPGTAKAPSPAVPAPDLFPTMNYSSQLPTNYFIPAPVEGNENAPTDFLSQPNPSALGRVAESNESFQPQALSRWSSTSSLSREVQKYTMKRGGMSKVRTQGSSNVGEDYYKNNGQWSGGPPRYPPSHTSSLPRSKGYPK